MERLQKVLGQIGLELWFPWQPIAPIGLLWEKSCEHSSSFIFDRIFFILAGNEDIHNISDEFEIWPDRVKDWGVNCPWASGKIPIDVIMEEFCEHSSSFIFYWINLILAGNEDMHESLNEFKFRPDTTTNSRVMLPLHIWKIVVNTLAPTFLIGSSSFFSGINEDTQQVWTEFEFWPDGTKGCSSYSP